MLGLAITLASERTVGKHWGILLSGHIGLSLEHLNHLIIAGGSEWKWPLRWTPTCFFFILKDLSVVTLCSLHPPGERAWLTVRAEETGTIHWIDPNVAGRGLRSGFCGEGGATYWTQYKCTIISKIICSQRIQLEINVLFTVLHFYWSVSIVHVKSINRIKGKSGNQSLFLFLFHVQWIKCAMGKIFLAVMNPQTAIKRLCMCPQLYVDLFIYLIVLVEAWVVFFLFSFIV